MTLANPDIALVVKTRNRADGLDAFFAAIRRIEMSCPWELIIVDNGSTDETAIKLNTFVSEFQGHSNVITEPRRGAGFACNAGWRATNASIIAFTDDDCYPEPDYLKNMLEVFADQSLGFTGGRILLYDPTDAPVTINTSQTEKYLYAGSFVWPGFVNGANMGFRRQALMDIGGFDNAFGPGTPFVVEEADIALRGLASGWNGKYDPRPVVYHHHGRKPGKDVESIMRVYDAGRGAYYMKCMLFMPQRWQCAWFWLRCVGHQPLAKTAREVYSAVRYLFHLLRHKPNITY